MSTPAKQPLEPENRIQALYTEIRNRICLLQYPPGMALREEALATEFGVSRTPIRSVLQRLEFEELVTHTPGAGVIVTTIDLKSLREVYALRLKIMEFMSEMMTTRVDEIDIAALEALIAACQAKQGKYDPAELGRLYHEFHHIMLRFISNRSLRRIHDQLFHQTARVWLDILPELDWDEEVEVACQEIVDVTEALRQADMQKVIEIRREHMALLLQRINQYLSSADSN